MENEASGVPLLPVRAVLRRTGLSADVLRAWERRYGAVRPARSAGGRRLYEEAEVERLSLLRQLTLAGHAIGQIAALTTEALRGLASTGPAEARLAADFDAAPSGHEWVEGGMNAISRLDGRALEGVLRRAALALGPERFTTEVVAPILSLVGSRWHAGALTVREEHLTSASVRSVLLWLAGVPSVGPEAPRLVLATPSGERHELGILMAGAIAAFEGWQPVHLGADLPVAEIAAAADSLQAQAVAVSFIHPIGAPLVESVVRELRRRLPAGVELFVGGAAAAGARLPLAGLPRTQVTELPGLVRALRSLGAVEAPASPRA